MENGTDITCAPLEDNEMSVDTDFSSGSSQNASFILSSGFQTGGNKCPRVMKASRLKRCNFKRETEGEAQEVPECEMLSDEDEQRMSQIQHVENRCRAHSEHISEHKRRKLEIPEEGTPVENKRVKRAGMYLLGPVLGSSPVKSIVQCLARRDGTDDFYTLKILTLEDAEEETQDDRQGRMLLHTEYSLLSLLHNQDGVIHHHGFFKDCALEERQTSDRGLVYTGKVKQRLCLVLDCLCAHDFSSRNADLLNLQHYVIREKKLSEKESIVIFYDTVRVVDSLHKKNIVHRDLKLGNLVLNRCTRRVTITNFCLGKHLGSENDRLKDQRGSPAYISPDVLCGKPYLGKPSDMWALGVVLFTMLYGQFPFYDSSPTQLFNKIRAADYSIPSDGRVSENTISLIRRLLVLEPKHRMTASEVLDFLSVIIATSKLGTYADELLQVVPDIDDSKEDKSEVKQCLQEEPGADRMDDFQNITQQEQNESEQYIGPSMMAAQCIRRAGQIPTQRIGQDAHEVTGDELNQYQHLLHPVLTGQPFSVVPQPTRSLSHHYTVSQSLGGLPSGDTERMHSVTETGNMGRVAVPVASSSMHSQDPVHLYQVQPCQGLLNRHRVNVDRCVPVSHCPSNNTTAQCILNGSCLTQEVQNLAASQMQDNGEVGHNHSSSSVFQHRNAYVPDSLDHQKQLHGSEALGSNNCRAEGVRNVRQGDHSGSGCQVEPVITSVILSNRDSYVRQRQLSSFISSLGLTSAVTIPTVPYICNSHNSYRHETQSHSPQQIAARNLDGVRNSTSTRQGMSSSAQPSWYARGGHSSSVLQGMSQIKQDILRQCSISPRFRRNLVQRLSLILQSRHETRNSQTTDDSSNGRGRN